MDPAKFEVLADWCSMGHLPSMRRMRKHFESLVSPEARRRMEDYLNDEAETLFDWDEWLEVRPDDCFNVRAAAFFNPHSLMIRSSNARRRTQTDTLLPSVKNLPTPSSPTVTGSVHLPSTS